MELGKIAAVVAPIMALIVGAATGYLRLYIKSEFSTFELKVREVFVTNEEHEELKSKVERLEKKLAKANS